jgi:hypothetical protein
VLRSLARWLQPFGRLAHLNVMSRTTPLFASPTSGGDGGFCRRLPEVSARERDFWRRAVEEERARLDLGGHDAAASGRQDVH